MSGASGTHLRPDHLSVEGPLRVGAPPRRPTSLGGRLSGAGGGVASDPGPSTWSRVGRTAGLGRTRARPKRPSVEPRASRRASAAGGSVRASRGSGASGRGAPVGLPKQSRGIYRRLSTVDNTNHCGGAARGKELLFGRNQ